MLRRKSSMVVSLAAIPLLWSFSGCGGGDSTPTSGSSPSATPSEPGEGSGAATGGAAPEGAGGAAPSSGEAAASGGWGTIKGTVVFGGEAPEPAVLVKEGDQSAKDAAVCAAQNVLSEELVVNKENKGVKWVLVYVSKPADVHPDLKEAKGEVELGQKFCVFKPHVLAFRQGQKLKVSSEDPVGHNTNMQPFKNQPWNQIVPAPAEGEKNMIDGPDLMAEPRPIKVQCNVHNWMSAWLYVSDHPYFAVTDENGAFEIPNVPSGSVHVVFWQEKIGYGEGGREGKQVSVKDGETSDIGQITLQAK